MTFRSLGDKVQALLVASGTLQTLLGGAGRVRRGWPNSFVDLPIVAWMIASNRLSDYADNVPLASEAIVEIHSFTDGTSALDIADAVDAAMIADLWNRDFSGDVPEPESKIRHVVARYSRKMTTLEP